MTDIHIPVHVPLSTTEFIFNPLFEEGFFINDINGEITYDYYDDLSLIYYNFLDDTEPLSWYFH